MTLSTIIKYSTQIIIALAFIIVTLCEVQFGVTFILSIVVFSFILIILSINYENLKNKLSDFGIVLLILVVCLIAYTFARSPKSNISKFIYDSSIGAIISFIYNSSTYLLGLAIKEINFDIKMVNRPKLLRIAGILSIICLATLMGFSMIFKIPL